MKNVLKNLLFVAALSCMCVLSFGMTAHASVITSDKKEVATQIKTDLQDKLQNSNAAAKLSELKALKEKVDSKIDKHFGNLVNVDLGDVGSVDVSTSDNVNVNLNDVPININVNINFGNITIGGVR